MSRASVISTQITKHSFSSRHSRSKKKKSVGSISGSRLFHGDNVIYDEDEENYNFREELTYVFFNSALEHIIERRESTFLIATTSTTTAIPSLVPVGPEEIKTADPLPLIHKKRKKGRGEKSSRKSITSIGSFSNYQSAQSISSSPSVAANNEPHKPRRQCDWIISPVDRIEKIYFKTGNVYVGNTSKWLMHGKGTYIWSDRTCYKGQFVDGLMDGHGKITLPDLSTYEGDFKNNFFHGNGVFSISSTPSVYKGSWKNGMKHGDGWFLYEQNSWYEGEWFENRKHGMGLRQYKNGTKYRGMWSHDSKKGQGSMIWPNNDIYIGNWENNQCHGYGEYTWNAIFSKYFLFPYSNWYKGSWVNGIRSGVGMMNFGTECGATLAGTWESNKKHGPGIMICGNGIVKQCSPLFVDDKPVHLAFVGMLVCHEDLENMIEGVEIGQYENGQEQEQEEKPSNLNETEMYRKIFKQISSKIPSKKINSSILHMITENGLQLDNQQFIVLEDNDDKSGATDVAESKKFCPMFIPIHTRAEEVDVSFFVDTVWNFYFPNQINPPKNDKLPRESIESNLKTTQGMQKPNKQSEGRMLQSTITLHLPKLTEIYDQYATIMADEKRIKRKVIMIRLFLWQLLRDVELPANGIPLIEVDTFLAKNPKCCLQSDHDPFEPIYFWQFLQALVGCAWLFYLSKKLNEPIFNGLMSHIFSDFLENHVFTCAGKFKGKCLTQYKDLLPIKNMYKLYLRIGDPMSVFDFIYFTCIKSKQPMCYTLLEDEEKKPNPIKNGNNVTAAAKLVYLEEKEDIIIRVNRDVTEEVPPDDPFYKTLFTFRSLGRKKVVSFLRKICSFPITKAKLYLDYRLTFLEFYETLLLCTSQKLEDKRRYDEKVMSVAESKSQPTTSVSNKLIRRRSLKKRN